MFKFVALLAAVALAQADPAHLPYAYGAGHFGYAHAPAVAHAPLPLDHGHGYGFGWAGLGHHHDHSAPFLSCYESHTDGTLKNAIAVNIKPRTYGYGLAGYGAGHAGLEATINVYSEAGGDVTISFTEKANALGSGQCIGADYGDYIGPHSYDHDASADHDHHHGWGFGWGYGHGHFTAVAPSVAKTTLAAEMMASFHIDHLEGFTSMAQLAGRGVMVCDSATVVKDDGGHWGCPNDGTSVSFPCCSLHYSGAGDSLNADGTQHA